MKNLKITFVVSVLICAALFLSACNKTNKHSSAAKIGIILPIEHQALNEIVAGFKETLAQRYRKPIEFKVANGQGDANLLHSIVEQMRNGDYTMIVPIATSTAEMTIAAKPRQPIVAIAADISSAVHQTNADVNVAVVDDELAPAHEIELIHTVYPRLKNLVLIHSTSDKIYPEVMAVKAAAKTSAINVRCIMVQNLPELYSAVNSISKESEAIFILKDSLIVSGLDTLVKASRERKIPLITSDDGSVQKGATFALGVHEKQIGVEGAKLAAQILSGTPANQLPITKMTKGTVYFNRAAIAPTDLALLKAAAHKLQLPIEDLTPNATTQED